MISKKELTIEKQKLKDTLDVLSFFEEQNSEKQILEKQNFSELMEYYQRIIMENLMYCKQ